MSTEAIYRAVLPLLRSHLPAGGRYLDVGSGTGELLRRVRAGWRGSSFGCDYTGQWMQLPGQKVDVADLNRDPLPYESAFFDAVSCTEVIEHLDDYRRLLREIFRVLRPGGIVVLSTPNILNLKSRLRFLWFGFWNLFGPLSFSQRIRFDTDGHITPVHYFHLAHALHEAGFTELGLTVDRWQRSSLFSLVLLYLPIRIFGGIAYRQEERRYRTIAPENAPHVKAVNALPLLLGRTCIIWARKPVGAEDGALRGSASERHAERDNETASDRRR
ncbi:putative S-adenosylmethionine-dependent methyltransferase/MSMEI_2290 [Methylacidimicrobium cyclopophantes]|uniref:S-adenosylmethionine-dependent methyltransferase/MSMEI_2290 n=1 Tax=Methylacidimicrobium cyclopophantes TaxID=1041766 RepID=A0A5E6MLK9_9BACT|nr:class I SAM-dependent methyltransferase [Methylacidimicrobium cyclopophantes]VVM06947.1 putative S-adenosylmethionine-dependent methyltransferase/MSMEI_2290 [Methylacidimicrobium cyclopophantes]